MKGYQLLLLSVVFSLAVAAEAVAQNFAPERRFEASAVAGVNIAQLDGDQLRGFRKWGFQGGMRVNVLLSERWKAGFELLYSQQGARRSNLDMGPFSEFDIDEVQINMVELPVLVHFSDWKVQLTAGGSYGNIINYQIQEAGGGDGVERHPLSDNVFSLILGGAFNFTENVALEIRWSRWLASPYDEAAAEANDETLIPWIGRMITVRGAYTF